MLYRWDSSYPLGKALAKLSAGTVVGKLRSYALARGLYDRATFSRTVTTVRFETQTDRLCLVSPVLAFFITTKPYCVSRCWSGEGISRLSRTSAAESSALSAQRTCLWPAVCWTSSTRLREGACPAWETTAVSTRWRQGRWPGLGRLQQRPFQQSAMQHVSSAGSEKQTECVRAIAVSKILE